MANKMKYMYLTYRIKDHVFFSSEIVVGSLFSTRKEAEKSLKRGWRIKRVKVA